MVARGEAIPTRGVLPADGDALSASRADLAAALVAGLAHEVRNPLNAMAIHLEVLADKLREAGAIPPALEKNLEGARSQIGRVDDIVRRFADFVVGRTDAGPADVAACAEWAHALCEHTYKRGGVGLVVEIAPGLAAAMGAVDLVHLLVACLLAWGQALGRGGRLRLTAGREGGAIAIRGEATGLLKEPAPVEAKEVAAALGASMEVGPGFVLRLRPAR